MDIGLVSLGVSLGEKTLLRKVQSVIWRAPRKQIPCVVRVSPVEIKYHQRQLGDKGVDFSLQPSSHTPSWKEVRAGTVALVTGLLSIV